MSNNKEIAKTWYSTLDTNNYDAVKNLMAPDHKFHNSMTPAPLGKDEHIGMIQMMMGALEGNHHLDLLISEGEYVTVRGHWAGKHVGEFQGVPATGKPVQFTFTDILHIVNGKIADEYLELNPMSIMAQIGAIPA